MLLWQFKKKKNALGPFPKSLMRISQECEPCANSFLGQIFKTMLSVWVLTGMRNFRITQGVMRNLHFLFKDRVLLFPCSLSSSSLSTSLFRSPNPSLAFTKPKPQAKDSSHVFFKGNPFPPGRGAPNFKFSS